MEISRNSTEIELLVLTCLRCGHSWYPRRPKLPAHCPSCCSPYWNKPRQRLRATPEPTEKHLNSRREHVIAASARQSNCT